MENCKKCLMAPIGINLNNMQIIQLTILFNETNIKEDFEIETILMFYEPILQDENTIFCESRGYIWASKASVIKDYIRKNDIIIAENDIYNNIITLVEFRDNKWTSTLTAEDIKDILSRLKVEMNKDSLPKLQTIIH